MMQNINPFSPKPKKKRRQPQNFVEALKSIGGHSQGSNEQSKPLHSQPSVLETSEVIYRGEELSREVLSERDIVEKQRHLARHKEITTPVYDRRQEQVDKRIDVIRQELKAIAKELAALSLSIEKAINEEIASPGSYHINFFEKLRSILITLRKQASDSHSWLEVSMQRKAAKNVYWGNVKRSGTKYMLSSERTSATSVG